MQTSRTNSKKKKHKNMLCFACLSADRKLYNLLQFMDIFKQICKNIVQGKNSDIFLCFECLALLRNVKKFQDKVQKSQSILKSYKQGDGEINLLNNFSNLSTTIASLFDFSNPVDYDDDESLMEEKPNLDLDIKEEEEDHYSNDFNTFDYDDDEPLVDAKIYNSQEIHLNEKALATKVNINEEFIKDETILKNENDAPKIKNVLKREITKEEAKDVQINPICSPPSDKKVMKTEKVKRKRIHLFKDRSELYKIIRLKNSAANVYKRVKIPYEEIKYWLEKDRNSIFFMRTKYKCGKCATRIVKKKLNEHARRHLKYTEKVHYTCDYCTLSFRRKVLLISHINTAHSYIRCCNICGYKCVSKDHMYKHVKKEHSMPRAVQCLQCKTNFRTTREFYKHYHKDHYEFNRTFICDYCNKKYKFRRTIEKHIFNNHTTHPCSKCPLTFTKPSRLKSHYTLKHSISRSEASYCVKCDRQFDNVPQFRNHLASSLAHQEERSRVPKKQTFQCPACPNVYAKGCSMMNHYNKVHASKARYHCTDCDKIFLTNSKLKDHIKYHHEGHERERKYICNLCGRGFTQNQVLKKHIRTHTGERPYECAHCDSKFAQRTAMLTHVKNIHVKKELKLQSQGQIIFNI